MKLYLDIPSTNATLT